MSCSTQLHSSPPNSPRFVPTLGPGPGPGALSVQLKSVFVCVCVPSKYKEEGEEEAFLLTIPKFGLPRIRQFSS